MLLLLLSRAKPKRNLYVGPHLVKVVVVVVDDDDDYDDDGDDDDDDDDDDDLDYYDQREAGRRWQ